MSFEPYANVRRQPAFRDAARDAGLNEHALRERCNAEAAENATWARRAPGTTGNAGDLGLQVDAGLAIAAAFVVTP